MEKIGFIGLGKMGSQLCVRLLKAGHTVIGYNRTKEKAKPLIKLGMKWADTPKEIIQACSIIFMSLTDDKAVSAIMEGSDGLLSAMKSGKLLIDMSTVSPETSRKFASEIQNKEAQMLDAPISGSPISVEQGKAMIMVGGDYEIFMSAKSILESICPNVFYVGKNGTALLLKLAINANLAVQFHAFSEGVLLVQKAGLDLKNAIEIMTHSAMASPGVQYRAPYILSPPDDPLFTIKMMQKDLLLALEQGRELGVPLLNTALTNEILTLACAQNYGDEDLAFLYQSMKKSLEKKN